MPAPTFKNSKLKPYLDLMGERTDAEIAEIAGVSRERVRQVRKRLLIEPPKRRGMWLQKRCCTQQQVEQAKSMFGTASDLEISRQTGMSPYTVRELRRYVGQKTFPKPMALTFDQINDTMHLSMQAAAVHLGVHWTTIYRSRLHYGFKKRKDEQQ